MFIRPSQRARWPQVTLKAYLAKCPLIRRLLYCPSLEVHLEHTILASLPLHQPAAYYLPAGYVWMNTSFLVKPPQSTIAVTVREVCYVHARIITRSTTTNN